MTMKMISLHYCTVKKVLIFLPFLLAAVLAGAELPPARSVIEIWVWGGPSHLDTFDPKPGAGRDWNGGYGAIPTNVEGIEISEFLPKLARQADKFSIIRSMTHGINAHETATYLMQTGRMPGDGITWPAIGAVIAMCRADTFKGELPPYIALTISKGRFSESGFLGERFKPLATGGNPAAERFQVDGYVPPADRSPEELAARDHLRLELDRFGKAAGEVPALAAFDRAGEEALAIMNSDDVKAFDLSSESPEMRDRYGRNPFGQSCLIARRLVERGIPYITINAQGWDSHKKHFETMKQRTAEMDQGFAALLEDLSEKGLLDSTIVWWSGEFGRTPRIDWNEPWLGGRNHYGACFSAVVAGGGFAGGRVLGASDERGEHPVVRPVTPVDLLWSIYERCGINPAGPLPGSRNSDAPILPGDGSGRIRELYRDSE